MTTLRDMKGPGADDCLENGGFLEQKDSHRKRLKEIEVWQEEKKKRRGKGREKGERGRGSHKEQRRETAESSLAFLKSKRCEQLISKMYSEVKHPAGTVQQMIDWSKGSLKGLRLMLKIEVLSKKLSHPFC